MHLWCDCQWTVKEIRCFLSSKNKPKAFQPLRQSVCPPGCFPTTFLRSLSSLWPGSDRRGGGGWTASPPVSSFPVFRFWQCQHAVFGTPFTFKPPKKQLPPSLHQDHHQCHQQNHHGCPFFGTELVISATSAGLCFSSFSVYSVPHLFWKSPSLLRELENEISCVLSWEPSTMFIFSWFVFHNEFLKFLYLRPP